MVLIIDNDFINYGIIKSKLCFMNCDNEFFFFINYKLMLLSFMIKFIKL